MENGQKEYSERKAKEKKKKEWSHRANKFADFFYFIIIIIIILKKIAYIMFILENMILECVLDKLLEGRDGVDIAHLSGSRVVGQRNKISCTETKQATLAMTV